MLIRCGEHIQLGNSKCWNLKDVVWEVILFKQQYVNYMLCAFFLRSLVHPTDLTLQSVLHSSKIALTRHLPSWDEFHSLLINDEKNQLHCFLSDGLLHCRQLGLYKRSDGYDAYPIAVITGSLAIIGSAQEPFCPNWSDAYWLVKSGMMRSVSMIKWMVALQNIEICN